jgi:hypothetical protein
MHDKTKWVDAKCKSKEVSKKGSNVSKSLSMLFLNNEKQVTL